MEIFIGIVLFVIAFMIIKYILKKVLFGLFIMLLSGVISFVYKTPYSISLLSILIILYGSMSIYSELKYMSNSLLKSRKTFSNGGYEKICALLFSINYISFMFISYMLFISKGFYMLDIIEFIVTFIFTWVCVWFIGKFRYVLFSYLSVEKYEI